MCLQKNLQKFEIYTCNLPNINFTDDKKSAFLTCSLNIILLVTDQREAILLLLRKVYFRLRISYFDLLEYYFDSFFVFHVMFYFSTSFCRNYFPSLPLHCTKNESFLLRISSVNVTKSAVSCGFRNVY